LFRTIPRSDGQTIDESPDDILDEVATQVSSQNDKSYTEEQAYQLFRTRPYTGLYADTDNVLDLVHMLNDQPFRPTENPSFKPYGQVPRPPTVHYPN
jgi:hypothetical protein